MEPLFSIWHIVIESSVAVAKKEQVIVMLL